MKITMKKARSLDRLGKPAGLLRESLLISIYSEGKTNQETHSTR